MHHGVESAADPTQMAEDTKLIRHVQERNRRVKACLAKETQPRARALDKGQWMQMQSLKGLEEHRIRDQA